ncbi:hypothetical protein BN1723_021011, partial [Verticillium longisporum]
MRTSKHPAQAVVSEPLHQSFDPRSPERGRRSPGWQSFFSAAFDIDSKGC